MFLFADMWLRSSFGVSCGSLVTSRCELFVWGGNANVRASSVLFLWWFLAACVIVLLRFIDLLNAHISSNSCCRSLVISRCF